MGTPILQPTRILTLAVIVLMFYKNSYPLAKSANITGTRYSKPFINGLYLVQKYL